MSDVSSSRSGSRSDGRRSRFGEGVRDYSGKDRMMCPSNDSMGRWLEK